MHLTLIALYGKAKLADRSAKLPVRDMLLDDGDQPEAHFVPSWLCVQQTLSVKFDNAAQSLAA